MAFTFQVSFEDDKHSGQPSTSETTENVGEVRELINEDCSQTIRELADTIGVNYGACQEILTENLNMCLIVLPSRQHSCPHVPENHKSL
jgi:hypothetical protein